VEQQAHNIHSYKPSSLALCSFDCNLSFMSFGTSVFVFNQGSCALCWWKNWVRSGTRSLSTCMCGSGWMVQGLLLSCSIFARQAKVLFPLMFIAQEPQMPSRQDRRNVSVGSISFLILISASNTIGPHSDSLTGYVCILGLSLLSGFHR